MTVTFRTARAEDADAIAEVYLLSRKMFVAFAPLAHTDSEVREWIAQVLLPSGSVTVAEAAGTIVGMMAVSREAGIDWLEHLYLHPSAVGQGIGTRLLERAKTEMGSPIRLYTFQANTGARRFYERHGFVALDFSNGADNEEKCPDILYEWRRE